MEKYLEQLKPLFEKVGDKIGQGAEYTWEIIVRQQIAEGITYILEAIIGIVLLILIYKFVKYLIKKDEEYLGFFIGFFGGGFILFLTILGFEQGILKLINPSYYALQFFINLVK